MGWISVKDQLPEDEVSVLVHQYGNDVCHSLIVQAQIFNGYWYADHENGLIDFQDSLDVKWWQPLPEPPK